MGRYDDTKVSVVTNHRGERVTVRGLRRPGAHRVLGQHLLRQGQRIDHLAHAYLGDSTRVHAIVDANGAMSVEQVMSQTAVTIPEGSE